MTARTMAARGSTAAAFFALEVVTVRPYIGPIPTCRYMALMRPRWTRDQWPQAYVCTRCGRPVPKYERLWMERQREMEKGEQRRY